MVKRGEVWWSEHPEAGRRPFLILTRDEAIPVLSQVTAVPATRTNRDIPTEVRLDEGDGMPAQCVVALDNVASIRVGLCTERVTELDASRMDEVCQALARIAAC